MNNYRPRRSFHCRSRPPCAHLWYQGALVVLVGVQLSVARSYLALVLTPLKPSYPPQTIISLPVQTVVCPSRAEGALVSVVGVHVSSMQSLGVAVDVAV